MTPDKIALLCFMAGSVWFIVGSLILYFAK